MPGEFAETAFYESNFNKDISDEDGVSKRATVLYSVGSSSSQQPPVAIPVPLHSEVSIIK